MQRWQEITRTKLLGDLKENYAQRKFPEDRQGKSIGRSLIDVMTN